MGLGQGTKENPGANSRLEFQYETKGFNMIFGDKKEKIVFPRDQWKSEMVNVSTLGIIFLEHFVLCKPLCSITLWIGCFRLTEKPFELELS